MTRRRNREKKHNVATNQICELEIAIFRRIKMKTVHLPKFGLLEQTGGGGGGVYKQDHALLTPIIKSF